MRWYLFLFQCLLLLLCFFFFVNDTTISTRTCDSSYIYSSVFFSFFLDFRSILDVHFPIRRHSFLFYKHFTCVYDDYYSWFFPSLPFSSKLLVPMESDLWLHFWWLKFQRIRCITTKFNFTKIYMHCWQKTRTYGSEMRVLECFEGVKWRERDDFQRNLIWHGLIPPPSTKDRLFNLIAIATFSQFWVEVIFCARLEMANF